LLRNAIIAVRTIPLPSACEVDVAFFQAVSGTSEIPIVATAALMPSAGDFPSSSITKGQR
jgi:hypothetical protein